MKLRIFLSALALLGVLVACGPADVEQAANEAAVTAEAAANDPGVQATAEAIVNDPGVQATAEAIANDPTVQALANEAAATIEAMTNDPALAAALDEAFGTMNDELTITQGQALNFDALSSVTGIENWTMTIVEPPSGASASKGQVVKEASGNDISLNPDEYEKYFTTSGDYRVRLDVENSSGGTASQEFTITVP